MRWIRERDLGERSRTIMIARCIFSSKENVKRVMAVLCNYLLLMISMASGIGENGVRWVVAVCLFRGLKKDEDVPGKEKMQHMYN